MTLVVETGQGGADSESYASVAFADQYHEQRANVAWAGLTEPQKEAYLRRATEYMLGVYRQRWKGARATATQALDWPRMDVEIDTYSVPAGSVPVEVRKACAILALKAIKGELDPDPTAAIKRKKVDVLEVEYYDTGAPLPQHKVVTDLLKPFLGGIGLNIQLVRA
jgi:hypothetical protein